MTKRVVRIVFLTVAVLVLAFGSALGAQAITANGHAATPPQLSLVSGADQNPPGAQANVSAQAVSDGSCHCQAKRRLPPPPPGPAPLIYSGSPQPAGGVPHAGGKFILVSLAQQWVWGYQDGNLMLASPVTTGMPALPTPTGTFNVFWKVRNTTFISPWPQGSQYYYPPEHVNYALEFLSGGFFLHDAPWRLCFGPGTNVPHTCPGATVQETGSHGCVNMPTPTGAWLYAWAPYGTTVIIR